MFARTGGEDPLAEEEILDRLDLPLEETSRALLDLAKVNRWLFGSRALRVTLLPLLLRTMRARFTLLDVAAGAGDAMAPLRRAVRSSGAELEVVSLDRKLSHLLQGRRRGHIKGAVVARAERLPFVASSFDWTASSLFFHHLDDDGKREVIGEMTRVSRNAAIIIDLRRSRWAGWALRVSSVLLRMGAIARDDGLVSIRRSWTVREWKVFLGPGTADLKRRFPARVALVVPPPRALESCAEEAAGGNSKRLQTA